VQIQQSNGSAGRVASCASVKANTIARLLIAARQEFARKGYASAKIDDIARSAGVTKQLVYHYYRDKEELFTCMLDDMASSLSPGLLTHEFDHLAPADALREFVNAMIDQYSSDPLLGPLTAEGIRYHNDLASDGWFSKIAPKLTDVLARILQRGVASGEFRCDTEPRALLGLIILTVTGTYTNRYGLSAVLGIDSSSPDGLAYWRNQLLTFVLHTILVSPKS
jgi:AcrR family transcriptional regulator